MITCQSTGPLLSTIPSGPFGVHTFSLLITHDYVLKLLSFHNLYVCLLSCSVMSDSLWSYRLQPARFLCPWNFLDRNTQVGCHFLHQGVFLTQGSNPGLLHCGWILYHLSYSVRMISISQRKKKGKERINQKKVSDPHL